MPSSNDPSLDEYNRISGQGFVDELNRKIALARAVDANSTSRQLPKYRCHKEVWALKIKEVVGLEATGLDHGGESIIIPEDEGFGPFRVSAEYTKKHQPKTGGYYVAYADGYKSFSPADAFESGYSKITD